jgi:2-phosphoglycolate phosphatase
LTRPPTSTAPVPAALLFDLDGTLVDSRRDIAVACNATRMAHSLPPLAFEAIMAMVGDGARSLVARAFGLDESAPETDAALATFQASYLARPCVYTALLPGVRAVLEDAADAGLPCAVITNKPRDVTLLVLDELGIAGFFASVWGGGDGPLKPSPAGVRETLTRLGVAPEAAWMIGDGPQDIGAGKAAGCFTVGIPGIAQREHLLASEPDLLCETADELHHLLGQTRRSAHR